MSKRASGVRSWSVCAISWAAAPPVAICSGSTDFAWGRSELIEYRSETGRRLQGALFCPAEHDASRQYPMIVYQYEILSPRVHGYVAPSERSYYNTTVWTSRGYFVLMPDIVYRPRDPAAPPWKPWCRPCTPYSSEHGTVDWHQGIKFYNFARRAGKESFVMLVYPGEDHGLAEKENQIDYHRRILQWFGHWLKDEPAPQWMTEGVSFLERKRRLEASK